MMRRIPGQRPQGRSGFTLIELLVVVAIIAILIALTTAGVQRVRIAAKRATVTSEIGQMGSAISAFQRDKKVDFIPSRIRLRERMDYDSNVAFERDSAAYLKQVWPHLPLALTPGGGTPPPAPFAGINWNGSVDAAGNPIIDQGYADLEGDQCLVFFLGGIPSAQGNGVIGITGFSNNPRDPSALPRAAPYFEFRTERLKASTNAAGKQFGYPSYLDPFGAVPYVYYSSNGRKNGYNMQAGNNGDCATVMTLNGATNFVPYMDTFQSATNYTCFQPTAYQIISAGLNKSFGVGGFLRTGGAPDNSADGDNITNFVNGQLSSY